MEYSTKNQISPSTLNRIQAISYKLWQYPIDNCIELKNGMTNDSFLVTCKKKKYIIRLNGLGTNKLIDRKSERINYAIIAKYQIGDPVIDINDSAGYKVTEYLENVHNCSPENEKDIQLCMRTLRKFHSMRLHVPHEFNLFEKINFYESLWKRNQSAYTDYDQVKQQVWQLKSYIQQNHGPWGMAHIDAVPDNFLITPEGKVYLIDWEYAAMCDCYVDIAMFSLYADYDKIQVDHLIDLYFENEVDRKTRILIYCYMAVAGLLWSNWCEFKEDVGIQFGEYAKHQYNYAKNYSQMVLHILKGQNVCS